MWSFTFKGESSRDYGITVNRRAPRQSANTRTVLTEIDGRDGAVIEKVGYNTYTMNMQITVQGKDNLHRISSWLKGEGKFTRSDIDGRYLLVKHESEIEFTMISNNLYTSQITFQVMYPKWLKEDSWSRPWGANLIPNGWDSFEPYGNEGKETRAPIDVFEDGYNRNYIPSPNSSVWVADKFYSAIGEHNQTDDFLEIKNNTEAGGAWMEFRWFIHKDEPLYKKLNAGGAFTLAAEVELSDIGGSGTGRFELRSYTGDNTGRTDLMTKYFKRENGIETYSVSKELSPSDDVLYYMIMIQIPHKGVLRAYNFRILNNIEDWKWTPSWEYSDDVDKPVRAWDNMAVHSQNIGGGLTRIRVKGGKHVFKLVYYNTIPENTTITTSIFFSKLRKPLRITVNNPWSYDNVYSSGCYTLTRTTKSPDNINTHIGTFYVNDSLDFIASTPTIVEGDKPPTWEADENPRIINEGTAPSQPIIKIIKNKEEKLDVVINGTRLIYEFDNSKYIDIDCYTQEVTDDQGLSKARNLKIGYEFPELKPGDNVVQVLSGDATILFRRKDAWK